MLKSIKLFFIIISIASNIDALPLKKVPSAKQAKKTPVKVLDINIAINSLQKQYNNAKSATFSFSQKYSHPIFSNNNESFGIVYYKQHNMKWHYQKPQNGEKILIIKNNKFILYRISDKIIYEHDCFSQDTLSASIEFLWGKGNIRQSFNISLNQDKALNQNLIWLTLIPKEKHPAVKSIYLGLNKQSFTVEESIVIDPNDGKNHFKFSNFILNALVPDKTFDFVPPKNIKIEKMPNVNCKENPVKKT
jgi:outer membrane lipoprotein-sorting protein